MSIAGVETGESWLYHSTLWGWCSNDIFVHEQACWCCHYWGLRLDTFWLFQSALSLYYIYLLKRPECLICLCVYIHTHAYSHTRVGVCFSSSCCSRFIFRVLVRYSVQDNNHQHICSQIIFKMDKFGQGVQFQSSMLGQNKELDLTGFTKQMLREMCILSGCDYLQSLPGMGLKRAHALVQKFKSYEKVDT